MANRGTCRLEDLTSGIRVSGVVGSGAVTVVAVEWHGGNAVTLTFREDNGRVGEQLLYRDHEAGLSLAAAAPRAFEADGNEFKLAAEALRIRMAARFDPMLAVTSSSLEALPHQIRAVYGELLDRTPLRFLPAPTTPARARQSWRGSTSRNC